MMHVVNECCVKWCVDYVYCELSCEYWGGK